MLVTTATNEGWLDDLVLDEWENEPAVQESLLRNTNLTQEGSMSNVSLGGLADFEVPSPAGPGAGKRKRK